ncbi:uncharacterized protein [Leptinotarsa decemlineata]|uniref:uncharacterized protein n=1 Tax=Leptinotarsa decemlineata TaxID=7539 RepID=UPI003D307A2D
MSLERVRILEPSQLLDKLKEKGHGLVAAILSDKNISGEKLIELTEFETIRWKLPLSQKKVLFNFIKDLKESPSLILEDHTTKPKQEFSKSTRNHLEKPIISKPKPKVNNDQNKAAFKQKLGTLISGPDIRLVDSKPTLPLRAPDLSVPFHGQSTPPRFEKGNNSQQKASFPDPPKDQGGGRKLPLPEPTEPRNANRNRSPSKPGLVSNKGKIPTPVESSTSSQTSTPSRSNASNSEKTRATDNIPKPPLPLPTEKKVQTKRSGTNTSTVTKVKFPLPEPVESNPVSPKASTTSAVKSKLPLPPNADRRPALPLPNKERTQTPTKSKLPTLDDTYVDMSKQDDINYGYLTPNDLAMSGNEPQRLGLPTQSSKAAEEDEPTYDDPDQVYEPPPRINLIKQPSPGINRTSPMISTRGLDNSNNQQNKVPENRGMTYKTEEKQGNGFLKNLFKRKSKLYENVEIENNGEHRVNVSKKIELTLSRPLPDLPTVVNTPPRVEQIPIGEPAGYIELTLHPPEQEEFYENYDKKSVKELQDEDEEANYSNTSELRRSPHPTPLPIAPTDFSNTPSPNELAAKLAMDLRARVWRNEAQSFDTDGSDFEMDPEEGDEEYPEQIYSNEGVAVHNNLTQKPNPAIVRSGNSKAIDQQNVDDQMEGGIYGNIDNPAANIWTSRPLPLTPVDRVDTVERRKKTTGFNYTSPQFTPVKNSSTRGMEEDEAEQIYGNAEAEKTHAVAENSHAEKTRVDTVERRKKTTGFNYTSPQFTPVKNISTRDMEEDEAEQIYGNAEAEKTHAEAEKSHAEKTPVQRESIFNISNEPYYRYTDRKGAKQLLRPLKNGAFLFRPSEKHFLVLTTKHNNKFYNFGIERSQAGKIRLTADYRSEVPEFSSLQEFVEYFSKEPLTFQEATSLAMIYLNPVLPEDVF